MSQTNAPAPCGVPAWTLADRLRKARESAGLKQAELASDLGIGRSTIVGYENGKTLPGRPVLMTWAMRCGVPLEWLRDGTEPYSGPDTPDGQGGSTSGQKEDRTAVATVVPLRSAPARAA